MSKSERRTMNRSEAAEQIEQIISDNNDDDGVYLGLRDIEALKIAVTALLSAAPEVPDTNVDSISFSRRHKNDLISRRAAIEALNICDANYDGIKCHKCPLRDKRWDGPWEDDETNCHEKLMRNSAKLLEHDCSESPNGWIPCSERLPEEYGEYRITWTTSMSKKPFLADAEYVVSSKWDLEHDRFKGGWLLDDYINKYPDVKVTAWKPIEEPYQPEEEAE